MPKTVILAQNWALSNYIAEINDKNGKLLSKFIEFDGKNWISIQVHWNLFQLELGATNCRLVLSQEMSFKEFSIVQKAPIRRARILTALCNLNNMFLFAIGGFDEEESLYLNSVERYNIRQNIW